jgi:gliding motility-associated-like protein
MLRIVFIVLILFTFSKSGYSYIRDTCFATQSNYLQIYRRDTVISNPAGCYGLDTMFQANYYNSFNLICALQVEPCYPYTVMGLNTRNVSRVDSSNGYMYQTSIYLNEVDSFFSIGSAINCVLPPPKRLLVVKNSTAFFFGYSFSLPSGVNCYLDTVSPINNWVLHTIRSHYAFDPSIRNVNVQLALDTYGTMPRVYLHESTEAIAAGNNTPVFNNFNFPTYCQGDLITFDGSSHDIEGDSLVYSLRDMYYFNTLEPYPYGITGSAILPYYLIGPAVSIPYHSGYGLSNLLGGSVPLTIDPHTGLITASADSVGAFLVNTLVSEYRDGELFTQGNRFYTFHVYPCSEPAYQPYVAATVDVAVCSDFSAQFSNNSIGMLAALDSSYYWDFGVLGTSSDTSHAFAPSYTYPDTGTYNVMLIAGPGRPCADTVYAQVRVYPTLQASYNSISSCVDVPISFYNTSTDPTHSIASMSWAFGDGTSASTANPYHTYNTVGSYNVQLIVQNSIGCQDTIVQSITVNNPTAAAAGLDRIICPGDTVFLNSNVASSYQWQGPDIITSNNLNTVAAAPTSIINTYTLTINDYYGCPPASDEVTITVDTTFKTDAGIDVSIAQGSSTTLIADGGISYLWLPSGETTSTINVQPLVTSTYTVISTDSKGCKASDWVRVIVQKPNIVLPNAFSPDGDNINDIYIPSYIGIANIEYFRIFNRWGELVFETNDKNKGWDGMYNGTMQPIGTFVVMAAGVSYNNEEVTQTGQVTIIR